jgi:tripartite-type tricarboxylate transporter receptor subunit TctC
MRRRKGAFAGFSPPPLVDRGWSRNPAPSKQCRTQAPVQAEDYPTRPITIVVPLAAGSGMDSLVRLDADKLQQSLGKPVIVENKPGATLMLAAAAVATATPDGRSRSKNQRG